MRALLFILQFLSDNKLRKASRNGEKKPAREPYSRRTHKNYCCILNDLFHNITSIRVLDAFILQLYYKSEYIPLTGQYASKFVYIVPKLGQKYLQVTLFVVKYNQKDSIEN